MTLDAAQAAVLDRGPPQLLLFLGDEVESGYAKTAFGLRDWAGPRCVGELTLAGAAVTTGLPVLSVTEAYARGARALAIGVATRGGMIPDNWMPTLLAALDAGLDIISGMHARLSNLPELVAKANQLGRQLIDVRVPPAGIAVGTGVRRPGWRVLTVGTDCALGKKYAALAITRGLQARGRDVTFRATGQTGIMLSGSGIPIDAVVADFVAGAAEALSPAAAPAHIDVIEGQGSIFHPSYAAVSLGLLHGSQPDRFVVCHQPGRTTMLGMTGFALPTIETVIAQTIALGRLTNPDIACGGVCLNTAALDPSMALAELERTSQKLGLPCADPLRGGAEFELLLDACAG